MLYRELVRPELICTLISVGAGLLGYRVLDGLGRTVTWGALAGSWSEAIPAALSIGLVEECAKLLPVAIVAWGSMAAAATIAAENLALSGIEAGVINARFAKPIDADAMQRMNMAVDDAGRTPADVAREFLESLP